MGRPSRDVSSLELCYNWTSFATQERPSMPFFRNWRAFSLAAMLGFSIPLWVMAAGETPEADRIISAGKEDSQVMDHLDYLCNRIGPRLTSSDNLQNACEWARDRFKSFGLENARLEEWGEFPIGFNRGP